MTKGTTPHRAVFNVTIDRRPALIARCATADDVVQSVNFARQQNLLVAIRGTGHNVAGFAVCDDGLVIDLSGMKGITIDAPGARCVWKLGALGRGERRAAAPRLGRDRWLCLGHRGFGPDPRRRPRLAGAQNMVSHWIICAPPKWSWRMAASLPPSMARTRIFFGRYAAAAATLASSHPSSSKCIRWGRCLRASSFIRARLREGPSAGGAT